MKKYILLFLILTIPLIPVVKVEREKIFERPLWKQIYNEYMPDQEVIEVLKFKTGDITSIDIYFAFWCGDSENNVPPFMKILDKIGVEGIEINYFDVERKKPGEKYYFEKLKVERVPTFIFFKKGKEAGRIIENPKKILEEDFLEIVF